MDAGLAGSFQGGAGEGGQAGPVAEVAVGGAAVGVGDGVGVGPDGVGRDGLEGFVWGGAGEVLPDEDPGGEYRLLAECLVAALVADGDVGEVGVGVVPEVADVLRLVVLEPLGFVQDGRARVCGECVFEELVELAGVARGLFR